jgi:hypothetical protein
MPETTFSFLKEKIKRCDNNNPEEVASMMRSFLEMERNQHYQIMQENVGELAKVVCLPFGR